MKRHFVLLSPEPISKNSKNEKSLCIDCCSKKNELIPEKESNIIGKIKRKRKNTCICFNFETDVKKENNISSNPKIKPFLEPVEKIRNREIIIKSM